MYTKLKQFNDNLKLESVLLTEKLAIPKTSEEGSAVLLAAWKGEQRKMDSVAILKEWMQQLTDQQLVILICYLENTLKQ